MGKGESHIDNDIRTLRFLAGEVAPDLVREDDRPVLRTDSTEPDGRWPGSSGGNR